MQHSFKKGHRRLFKTVDSKIAHSEIVIRVNANVNDLARKYYANLCLLRQTSDSLAFIRGFNMGHVLCDFIDAGDGKECAGAKLLVKGTILRNPQPFHSKGPG